MTDILRTPNIGSVKFIAEQDGIPERTLKDALARMFASRTDVRKGYLVRARYGHNTAEPVVLCIDAAPDSKYGLVAAIQEEFAKVFHKTVSLDIIFLKSEQVEEVSRVASPFYAAAVST